ncbi:MAG: YidC/Oxa1 family insertase periplasmic-domain containing protein [Paludisphaera borealis]|uniref:YidC/Oxa1 family insertase periplasmic-domain containing protein n=1 Tax=Paludisphaera borealis TaxID=1387353 RepID=UPI00284878EA|nr:YidC/Oxa1 family insertase periplasmic-domain containing protein [Paludisphaera borealis]MDR3619935.1 YidC/Oxa1 family insertase periplasmic-domain containing protein [Paludisphaera borealis]
MSNERRFVLFVVVMFGWLLGFPYLLKSLGLAPTPPPKPPAGQAAAAGDAKKALDKKAEDAKPAPEIKAAKDQPAKEQADADKPKVALVPAAELVMGSLADKSPTGYHLEVQLEQKGAGVDSVFSSQFDADFEARKNPHKPLALIRRDTAWPPSLALTLSPSDSFGQGVPLPLADREKAENEADAPAAPPSEDLLDAQLWEVVRDNEGRAVRPLKRDAEAGKPAVEGQAVVFKTVADNGVVVTKTFRLWQAADGFEVELRFESPDKERSFVYNLFGPHGILIEGDWYTTTFRDVFFGTTDKGATGLETYSADVVAKDPAKATSTSLPLRFTGIENQYFAILAAPVPTPKTQEERLERETKAVLLHRDPALHKSDVGVRISSKPVVVGPNLAHTHTFNVFAGPKTSEALAPYGAEDLASYRKSWIPAAPWIARVLITPTLSFTYKITEVVGKFFGGSRGNAGVAIILLTLMVKMMMFPLGRKQALMAQRSQQLQPYLKEIQEKYKEDKERLTKETFALYKKHGVNPVSGCLPALIQLPIFVGLWQALNTSISLRHAPFLWINNLAAPDMLFKFPFEITFLGWWFNLLPIIVVAVMLVQTKLFSPPATTPEAEMQQKTMKYMMVFMAVMFYKVPAGLGLYFITSSLWSIGERLLLPKITHEAPPAPDKGDEGSNGSAPATPKPPSGLAKFWTRILDEARKDPTYRKMVDDRDGGAGSKSKDRPNGANDRRDRDRGKPRARPGRK